MPQTGPRPVYKAPPIAPAATPRPAPDAPSRASRFSSVRVPQAPLGARPPLRPGERRPMHPTRQSPTGTRPLGVGPGGGTMPPPGPSRPGSPSGWTLAPSWPALCSARNKRRPNEGLHSAAAHGGVERADADHAQHHHHRRHQRQGPGRKARHSREGSDRAPAGARRFRDHQPDARCGTRQRDGALLRRRNRSHHLRRAGDEGYGRGGGRQRGRRRRHPASAGGHHHGPRRPWQDHAARLHPL